MNSSRPLEDHGHDVTSLLGSKSDQDNQTLFGAFQNAHKVACEKPCVTNFRACVEAFDEWHAHFNSEFQP